MKEYFNITEFKLFLKLSEMTKAVLSNNLLQYNEFHVLNLWLPIIESFFKNIFLFKINKTYCEQNLQMMLPLPHPGFQSKLTAHGMSHDNFLHISFYAYLHIVSYFHVKRRRSAYKLCGQKETECIISPTKPCLWGTIIFSLIIQ